MCARILMSIWHYDSLWLDSFKSLVTVVAHCIAGAVYLASSFYNEKPLALSSCVFVLRSMFEHFSGDSGGPLYRWYGRGKEMRAFIIGTVSRGTGCANFNQPGIFSRVKKHLKWIQNTIQDGNCKWEWSIKTLKTMLFPCSCDMYGMFLKRKNIKHLWSTDY